MDCSPNKKVALGISVPDKGNRFRSHLISGTLVPLSSRGSCIQYQGYIKQSQKRGSYTYFMKMDLNMKYYYFESEENFVNTTDYLLWKQR